MARLEIKIEQELLNSLSEICEDGERSEFIRQAIKEKINRKIISNEQLSNRMKKLDNLDTEVVYKTAVNIELTKLIFSLLPHFVWRVSFFRSNKSSKKTRHVLGLKFSSAFSNVKKAVQKFCGSVQFKILRLAP